MDEYISREETVKKIEEKLKVDGLMSLAEEVWTDNCLKIVLRAIMAVETADVQPVIHAHWIELPKAMNPNENPCKCSNCGHILSFMNYYPKSKYCPNCGARMEGDRK